MILAYAVSCFDGAICAVDVFGLQHESFREVIEVAWVNQPTVTSHDV